MQSAFVTWLIILWWSSMWEHILVIIILISSRKKKGAMKMKSTDIPNAPSSSHPPSIPPSACPSLSGLIIEHVSSLPLPLTNPTLTHSFNAQAHAYTQRAVHTPRLLINMKSWHIFHHSPRRQISKSMSVWGWCEWEMGSKQVHQTPILDLSASLKDQIPSLMIHKCSIKLLHQCIERLGPNRLIIIQ